jgi:hypothetical protein
VSDPSAATIDADGVLHPAHIPSDRAIQVQAEFTFGGRTRSASLPVTVLASQRRAAAAAVTATANSDYHAFSDSYG